MKFSLKHLILFVTIAAMLCGVVTYFYSQVIHAQRMALEARAIAENERDRAMHAANLSASLQRSMAASTQDPNYSILHWNVESGGNDPATIAKQLIALGRYNIIGLSEVAKPEIYEQAISRNWPDRYGYIRGRSGRGDKLQILYDKIQFDHVGSAEMDEANGIKLNDGNQRAPLYARLKDRSNDQELIVVLNHLARGDAEFRAQQAAGLREWARTKSVPIVAIGNYNFDYDFKTQKGNSGFDAFLQDGVWKWIKPDPMIDTNWSDNGNGGDRYPDSLLDFSFVAGAAKDWEAECRVIVRDGDFPDDEMTSDHRPIELILTK